jgi:vesicle transport through interaction with t-SNAREs protein 1
MDNSPTALFDTYEQDFRQILDSVRSKLDGDGKDERGGEDSTYTPCRDSSICIQAEQRRTALRRVEMELDEADEMACVSLLVSLAV